MSDDDAIREVARAALDKAVSDYCNARNTDPSDGVLGIVGAWALVAYSPTSDDEREAYIYETAQGQVTAMSAGLSRFAQLHYES